MLKLKKKVKKKLIIWGFAKVGNSVLKFFSHYFNKKKFTYIVIDQSTLSKEKIKLLQRFNGQFILQKNITCSTLKNCWIFPSPGVNIKNYYAQFQKNFIIELDLFHVFFYKPVIAITGSVGKTSITTICASILEKINVNCFVGGNIGIPMLEGVKKQHYIDCALLELSSFQLEYSHYFAPNIAVLTNMYPNHLDRHATFKNYIAAKFNIFAHQHKNQYAILPLALRKLILQTIPLRQKCIFFSYRPPTENEKNAITSHDTIIFMDQDYILIYHKKNITLLTSIPRKPVNFFSQNWLIVCAIFYALQIRCKYIHQNNLSLPEHRLEYVDTYKTVIFYNDSKSTTPSSTKIAIAQFQEKSIHLFLGGLSKGIDREPLIASCKNKSLSIYCFGKEAKQLSNLCTKYGITTSCHDTLETAFDYCVQTIRPEDVVLFSPSGSSFDLYANYEQRGRHFKRLVRSYTTKQNENSKQ